MKIDKAKQLIGKMIDVIKPNGVLDIVFSLEPLGIRDNEFYMNIRYVVPDDSEYLRSKNMRNSDYVRLGWNNEIKNSINNYFNIKVIINSTGISSQSYYNSQKEN
jgi:hypothetical protein